MKQVQLVHKNGREMTATPSQARAYKRLGWRRKDEPEQIDVSAPGDVEPSYVDGDTVEYRSF